MATSRRTIRYARRIARRRAGDARLVFTQRNWLRWGHRVRAAQQESDGCVPNRGETNLTTAAAILGLLAALLRLLIDASGPLRDWWTQLWRQKR